MKDEHKNEEKEEIDQGNKEEDADNYKYTRQNQQVWEHKDQFTLLEDADGARGAAGMEGFRDAAPWVALGRWIMRSRAWFCGLSSVPLSSSRCVMDGGEHLAA